MFGICQKKGFHSDMNESLNCLSLIRYRPFLMASKAASNWLSRPVV